MTILKDGKHAGLSAVRFTQEKGAKSSFERVLDGLEDVLRERALLVADKSIEVEMRAIARSFTEHV